MANVRLTKREVNRVQRGAQDLFLWDTELRGFGLKVTPAGNKIYVLQYRMGGREAPTRRYTIGRHGSPWTPRAARQEAERLLILVRQGTDPGDVKRQRRREAVTLAFSDYADRFVDLYLKAAWADTWPEAKRILDVNVKPIWRNRSLASIKKADVAEVLDRFADRPAMRKNTHSVLRKLFRWASRAHGDLASNPMADMDAPKPVRSRKRVLTREELVAVWLAAEKLGDPWRGVVRLLIATLQRREQVAGVEWPELEGLDGQSPFWELPPDKAKNDEGHRVPLCPLALAEIRRLTRRKRGLLFTTTGKTPVSGFSAAKARLDGLMLGVMRERAEKRGEKGDEIELRPWRFHDLRRTGTTMLQELGVPVEVTEAVINHISGTTAGVAGVYNRYKYDREKRRALNLWSAHLAQLIVSDADPATLEAFATWGIGSWMSDAP